MESSRSAPSADEENKMDLLKKGAYRPAHYKKGQQCETFGCVQKGSSNEANADVLVRGLKVGRSFSCYAML